MTSDNRRNDPYRAFVSYSHGDEEFAGAVMKNLRDGGFDVLSDREFRPGDYLDQCIKSLVCSAHIFIPVIPEDWSKRGWVFQEIGFALYHNIPIVPITRSTPPGGLLQNIVGIVIGSPEQATEKLSTSVIRQLFDRIESAGTGTPPTFRKMSNQQSRTEYIVQHARAIRDFSRFACIRQKGGLSSFNIPNEPADHPIWEQRAGRFPIDNSRREKLRAERNVLEEHVNGSKGLYLIINPTSYCECGWKAQAKRLELLLQYLNSQREVESIVALSDKVPHRYNLTIVGDWFYGEAFSFDRREGYTQTMFTHHCPEVRAKTEAFDREILSLLPRDVAPGQSRERACETLKELIGRIRAGEKSLRKYP